MEWFVNLEDGQIVDTSGQKADTLRSLKHWRRVSEAEAKKLQFDREYLCQYVEDAAREHARRMQAPRVSEIKLSTAIMAHPSRQNLLDRLLGRLGDVPVSLDTDGLGCWGNARRAWLMYDRTATHHLVLQEDVVPCDRFFESVRAALWAVPDEVVSLFSRVCWGESCPAREARRQGVSWGTSEVGAVGQGMVMPTCWIDEFVNFADRHTREECPTDDMRIDLWLILSKRLCWFTAPSLIDHDDRGNSTLWDKGLGDRPAEWFIGREASGLGIDWLAGAASPAHYPVPRPFERYAVWYRQ